jgi:hypothetical protein
MTATSPALTLLAILAAPACASTPPEGFEAHFNGSDLSGWKGLVGDPISRAAMTPAELAAAQAASDELIAAHWRVENGEIVNDGHGPHLCTDRDYGDFEMWIDWKITPGSDSGIYLRGSPQVQIWDPVAGIDQAKVGSGGLYNNQRGRSTPLATADRPAGEWNTFFIRMVGERVTVRLNDQLVVDDVALENYWDRSRPIFPTGQIELQTHGGEIRFRNIFIRAIGGEESARLLRSRDADAFTSLFNGRELVGWIGSTDGYIVEDGVLICDPARGGTLLTEQEYADFILRFEFRLPPGGNNGLAIRAPREGNPAYEGMELQILDDSAPMYASLQPYQFHGSIYGCVPSHRGYQRAVGEWNFQEVRVEGSRITVALNGTVILDTDVAAIESPIDGQPHPGLKRTAGHIGFMGHGDRVEFRNIAIRELR